MMVKLLGHISASICISITAVAGIEDSTKTAVDASGEKRFAIESTQIAEQLDSLMALHVFQFEGSKLPANYDSTLVPTFPDSIYAQRLATLDAQTPLELEYNEVVKRYIELYTLKRREQVSRMLALGEYYFPMFEETLDRYNIPLEIKYLAVVESALNPKARSRVGAKGLWQFMYSTGKLMGLKANSYVDERSDPYKSTVAACEYMTRLYNIFGDWNLVLAAYNSGPGNVNKAIRRSGGKRSYWELRPYLPRETAGYVPAFIAATYTMSYAAEHNLYASLKVPFFYHTDTALVDEQISFDQLNMWLGIDKEIIRFLNPSYKYEIIPKVDGQKHYLVLPRQQMGLFIDNEDSLYAYAANYFEKNRSEVPKYVEQERIRHRVRSGESLGLIANKYGTSVSKIKRWNGLHSNTIYPGQRLTIYKSGAAPKSSTASSSKPEVTKADGHTLYTVRKGDTLYDIAKKFPGVSATNLASWNNLNSSTIKPGMKLVVSPGSSSN
jgi:membrane-bound lytic murein transglycosylase D